MENPLISVIVPCYNVEKYVAECLRSIVEQSYENLEIIVVNDGATDNTEREILPFLEDKRIKYIVQENQGLSGARNTGLDSMNGEYVCFVDSDDFIHPDFVENLYQNLTKNDADIAICDFYEFEDGKTFDLCKIQNTVMTNFSRDEIMQEMLNNWKICIACNKLYKSKLFNDLRFVVGRIHEDEFILHHILWKANRVVKNDKQLYFYRQSQGSIMNSNYTDKKMRDCIGAFDDRILFFKNKMIPNINVLYNAKWFLVIERGIEQHNLNFAKKYFINNMNEFFTKTKIPYIIKLKLCIKFLLSLIKK